MTLEEEKDIEYLRKYINFETKGERSLDKAIDTVLKALEEQQKEIEEITIENENLTLSQLDLTKRNISKDEIREKIKDLQENNNGDDYNLANVVNILKELIGE